MSTNAPKSAPTSPVTERQPGSNSCSAPHVPSIISEDDIGEDEEKPSLKIPGWPEKPTTVPPPTSLFEKIASWVTEILLVSLPITFLILGCVAKLLHGKLVDSNAYGEIVIQATQYVSISPAVSNCRASQSFH
jgi:hypothetical protein